MTRLAFYAPMKSPLHPTPSGDRAMARALMTALQSPDFEPELVSEFSSRDGKGASETQDSLLAEANTEIARLVPLGRASKWRAWVTYHNYYKAPDLIGPAISHALEIPYILIEATRSRKRLAGPWARFAQAAEAATDAADVVLYFTEHDAEALQAYSSGAQRLVHLRPFLPRNEPPPQTTGRSDILSVGMFRTGDKLASYQLIAETLEKITTPRWHLNIAGDGPARRDVEAMMSPFKGKITFLGAVDTDAMQDIYRGSSILFWPGVNEAFGMAYLEAQAAGLTVLAQDRPGARDVLFPGAAYPPPEGGAEALAGRLDLLLSSPKLCLHLGQAARTHVARHHLVGEARECLRTTLDEVLA